MAEQFDEVGHDVTKDLPPYSYNRNHHLVNGELASRTIEEESQSKDRHHPHYGQDHRSTKSEGINKSNRPKEKGTGLIETDQHPDSSHRKTMNPLLCPSAKKFWDIEDTTTLKQLQDRICHKQRLRDGLSELHIMVPNVEVFAHVYPEFLKCYTRQQLRMLEKEFSKADLDQDEHLNDTEIKYWMEKYQQPISQRKVRTILSAFDDDKDCKLSFREFLLLCQHLGYHHREEGDEVKPCNDLRIFKKPIEEISQQEQEGDTKENKGQRQGQGQGHKYKGQGHGNPQVLTPKDDQVQSSQDDHHHHHHHYHHEDPQKTENKDQGSNFDPSDLAPPEQVSQVSTSKTVQKSKPIVGKVAAAKTPGQQPKNPENPEEAPKIRPSSRGRGRVKNVVEYFEEKIAEGTDPVIKSNDHEESHRAEKMHKNPLLKPPNLKQDKHAHRHHPGRTENDGSCESCGSEVTEGKVNVKVEGQGQNSNTVPVPPPLPPTNYDDNNKSLKLKVKTKVKSKPVTTKSPSRELKESRSKGQVEIDPVPTVRINDDDDDLQDARALFHQSKRDKKNPTNEGHHQDEFKAHVQSSASQVDEFRVLSKSPSSATAHQKSKSRSKSPGRSDPLDDLNINDKENSDEKRRSKVIEWRHKLKKMNEKNNKLENLQDNKDDNYDSDPAYIPPLDEIFTKKKDDVIPEFHYGRFQDFNLKGPSVWRPKQLDPKPNEKFEPPPPPPLPPPPK